MVTTQTKYGCRTLIKLLGLKHSIVRTQIYYGCRKYNMVDTQLYYIA